MGAASTPADQAKPFESAIPFVVIGATALNSTVVLLCILRQSAFSDSGSARSWISRFFRYQVSDRVHTLLSRFLHIRQLLFHVRQLLLLAVALLRRHTRHIAGSGNCSPTEAHRVATLSCGFERLFN